MAATPANLKLWSMIVTQAKTKFHPYPSIAASAWVHKTYVKDGGQFVDAKRSKSGRRR